MYKFSVNFQQKIVTTFSTLVNSIKNKQSETRLEHGIISLRHKKFCILGNILEKSIRLTRWSKNIVFRFFFGFDLIFYYGIWDFSYGFGLK